MTFFQKLCHLWDNVEKYFRVGQATDDNTAHVHCMLDTKGYKYTLSLCNTYAFSTATMVAWKCLCMYMYNASLVVSQLCLWNEWMGFKSLVSIHITSAHTFKSCNKCWGKCSVEFTEEFMSGCYDSLQTLRSRSSHFPAHVIIIWVFIIVIIINLFLSLHHNSIFTFISLIIVIVGIKGNVRQAQFCYLEHIKNDMWTPCCCISLQNAHSLS